eukprot:GDKJ01042115.1.p1 GENE.GDKJ01042115.1~~GDKJ01042115.1.p1  ORF type:complete len:536 (-),score=91.46 GDKJ01042115.1:52-1635(-)
MITKKVNRALPLFLKARYLVKVKESIENPKQEWNDLLFDFRGYRTDATSRMIEGIISCAFNANKDNIASKVSFDSRLESNDQLRQFCDDLINEELFLKKMPSENSFGAAIRLSNLFSALYGIGYFSGENFEAERGTTQSTQMISVTKLMSEKFREIVSLNDPSSLKLDDWDKAGAFIHLLSFSNFLNCTSHEKRMAWYEALHLSPKILARSPEMTITGLLHYHAGLVHEATTLSFLTQNEVEKQNELLDKANFGLRKWSNVPQLRSKGETSSKLVADSQFEICKRLWNQTFHVENYIKSKIPLMSVNDICFLLENILKRDLSRDHIFKTSKHLSSKINQEENSNSTKSFHSSIKISLKNDTRETPTRDISTPSVDGAIIDLCIMRLEQQLSNSGACKGAIVRAALCLSESQIERRVLGQTVGDCFERECAQSGESASAWELFVVALGCARLGGSHAVLAKKVALRSDELARFVEFEEEKQSLISLLNVSGLDGQTLLGGWSAPEKSKKKDFKKIDFLSRVNWKEFSF